MKYFEDTLFIKAGWTNLERSHSKPDRGFALVMCRAKNQRAEDIVEYGYRYLITCRRVNL